MPRLLTCDAGIGELTGDGAVRLLDVDLPDLDAALRSGLSLQDLAARPTRDETVLEAVRLHPPLRRPSALWGQGRAYRAHVEEAGGELPSAPRLFLAAPSALIASGEAIELPPVAPDQVDYEGEVAVVIGRRAYRIDEREAWDHVAGITICNDVSARDLQRGRLGSTVDTALASPTMGKSLPTFKPLGPVVASLDELDDVDDIGLTTHVDGELRQHARTSELAFGVPELVAFLSSRAILEPGDVILTGTPAGTAIGSGKFLRDGSVVRIEVEHVGVLENPVRSNGG